MDDQDVLQHLLEVEAQALTLVDDAQAEADKRVSEAEASNRSRYEERYGAEATALDEHYETEVASVRADYNRQLEEYRQSLGALNADRSAFSRLVDSFLRPQPVRKGGPSNPLEGDL
jgi:vacuolar-type H+-ATPase subunit H